eukprot:1749102-Rhodomonas_salina.1
MPSESGSSGSVGASTGPVHQLVAAASGSDEVHQGERTAGDSCLNAVKPWASDAMTDTRVPAAASTMQDHDHVELPPPSSAGTITSDDYNGCWYNSSLPCFCCFVQEGGCGPFQACIGCHPELGAASHCVVPTIPAPVPCGMWLVLDASLDDYPVLIWPDRDGTQVLWIVRIAALRFRRSGAVKRQRCKLRHETPSNGCMGVDLFS